MKQFTIISCCLLIALGLNAQASKGSMLIKNGTVLTVTKGTLEGSDVLIENGKITKPLKGATLIGEAKEIMNKISLCSQDLELAPGFCGSVSGSIYTTVGQPHIKVDSITVGGR
ncbi:MAG: hypothetical protein HGA42_20595 [Nostocales cyanobacterium W4_Combined_metabat2_030]|nr:hypothetical protein [Nostocales cyanobacterium W4_Combined_metabat2_030]